ncbi:hypothetical protein Hanom_Chr14g01265251 [Helianthus anomalus]
MQESSQPDSQSSVAQPKQRIHSLMVCYTGENEDLGFVLSIRFSVTLRLHKCKPPFSFFGLLWVRVFLWVWSLVRLGLR